MNSDTPRTDELLNKMGEKDTVSHEWIILRTLARQLERERNAANAKLAKAEELLLRISKQGPSKPDYWSSCSQCEHNIEDAKEVLTAYQSTSTDEGKEK